MKNKAEEEHEKIDVITNALKGLHFGELQITIHEGKIVQVNRIEKLRFPVKKIG